MDSSAVKESNPKDAIGCTKPPLSVLPSNVVRDCGLPIGAIGVHPKLHYMLALGMLEGACKYGRHNYRAIGVRASIYYDAFMRHMAAYRTGEFIDKKSGLPHLIKAGTSLIVLIDAMQCNKWVDDRPPAVSGVHITVQRIETIAAEWWDHGHAASRLSAALRAVCDEYLNTTPGKATTNWFDEIEEKCTEILALYPNPKAAFTQLEYPAK